MLKISNIRIFYGAGGTKSSVNYDKAAKRRIAASGQKNGNRRFSFSPGCGRIEKTSQGGTRYETDDCVRPARLFLLVHAHAGSLQKRAARPAHFPRRHSLPRPEKRSAEGVRAEGGHRAAVAPQRENPLCARQLRLRGRPDGAAVPGAGGLRLFRAFRKSRLSHARARDQQSPSPAVFQGRHSAPRPHACTGLRRLRRFYISEPRLGVDPEGKLAAQLYDF